HAAYREFSAATDQALDAADPADLVRLAGLLCSLAAGAQTTHDVDPPLAPAERDPIWRRWS
ncbi:MAG TPA: hypothetical protein VI300_00420, partial [Solirubrobacter sp.]